MEDTYFTDPAFDEQSTATSELVEKIREEVRMLRFRFTGVEPTQPPPTEDGKKKLEIF